MHSLSQAWEVHTTYDYEGYLSILIELRDGNNDQTSFFVSGTAKQLELSKSRGDDLSSMGTFNDVHSLTTQLLDHFVQL